MTKRYKTLSVILAGGKGSRLGDITKGRAKPAVPFGGVYRLIDIPLSNLHHSQLSDVWVVEQYLPHSLNDHLRNGRPWDLDRSHGGLFVLPPYQSDDNDDTDGFCGGNAEALNLQREFLEDFEADFILVLSADHLYRFDYRDLIDFHIEQNADLSTLIWDAPKELDIRRYSIFETDGDRVVDFQYKPEHPSTRLVGTEIFLFSKPALLEALIHLEKEHGSELGDYGDYLLPLLVKQKKVAALPHHGYWRDVGTVESYWEAQMELLEDPAPLPLDDEERPFITDVRFRAPAYFGGSSVVHRSLVSPCCRVEGKVVRSILGPGCRIAEGALVEDSILMEGVCVGPRAVIKKAVVDAGVEVNEAVGDGDEICLHFPKTDPTQSKSKAKRTRQTFS